MQWLINILKEWVELYFRGMIVIWSGAIVDIPSGWHLCDGTNGTPDLRNLFVVGAGDTYAVDWTGGQLIHGHDLLGDGHTHPFTGDGHSHDLVSGPGGYVYGTGDRDDRTQYDQATGTTSSGTETGITTGTSLLPPTYALAYIMKL